MSDQIGNNDIELSTLLRSLVSNFRIFIYMLIFFILSGYILFLVLGNVQFKKTYEFEVTFSSFDLDEPLDPFKKLLISKDLLLNINNEDAGKVIDLSLKDKDEERDINEFNTYGYFRIFSDILQSRSIKKRVEDKILEKMEITSIQFKNSNTKLNFDKQFSEIVTDSSQFIDFIKVRVISDNYNIAKTYLDELLILSSNSFSERVKSSVIKKNRDKLRLLEFKILSYEIDIDLLRKFFIQNYQDYIKFLEFNLNISEIYHSKNINQDDLINSNKSPKGIDKLINNPPDEEFKDEFIRVIRSGDFETFKELSQNKYYFNNPEIIKAYLDELNIFLASKDIDMFVPGLRSLQSKLEKAKFLLKKTNREYTVNASIDLIKSINESAEDIKEFQRPAFIYFFIFSIISSIIIYILFIYIRSLIYKGNISL